MILVCCLMLQNLEMMTKKMQQACVQSAGRVRKTTGFKKVIKPKRPQIIVSMC